MSDSSDSSDSSATVPAGPMFEMPASVPAGMRLELSRARLLPGAQEETERRMQMLHDRYEECLDTLSAERMAFEATFRRTDTDGTEWIYHLSLYGEETSGLDLSNPIDRALRVRGALQGARLGGVATRADARAATDPAAPRSLGPRRGSRSHHRRERCEITMSGID